MSSEKLRKRFICEHSNETCFKIHLFGPLTSLNMHKTLYNLMKPLSLTIFQLKVGLAYIWYWPLCTIC